MKKILIFTILAFLLVGCSNKEISVSNSDDVIWKSNKTTYTKADLFKAMKAQDYTSIVITDIVNRIGELEGLNIEEIKKTADDTIKEIIDQGGEEYIVYYYGSDENYKNAMVSSSIIEEMLTTKANKTYEEQKAEYAPYKAEVVYFDTKEAAQAAIDATKDEEHTFEYACLVNGYTTEIAAKVYTDVSDLPIEIKDYVLNGAELGISKVIETSTVATDSNGETITKPRYYVINLVSTNADEFKDEFIDFLVNDAINQDEVITEYMQKHNLKVYDQRTYELLKAKYGDFK